MLTGTALMNELVDELNELKLSIMAATLDDLYHKPGFLEMDRLTLIADLIGPQFQEKVSTTLKNRLTAAHLKGSPEELAANPVVRQNYLGRDFELKKKTRAEE